MSKRILTLALFVFVLALPLTASGQEMVSGPGEFPIVEEPITLNILMLGHAIVEDFNTNTFTEWYSERTGINLNFDIGPPNEWQEVLNLTIASGDLPDIIVGFTVDPTTLALFGPQGLFLPLSDLIEEHGHFIHEVFAGSPQVRPLITSPDGEIYGLPQVNECYHCFYSQRAWINSDWLEAVGMDVPQTTEEFVDVLTAFKEQDANGNGDPNDEIPLAAATTGWNPTIDGFLLNPFVFSEFTGQNPWAEPLDFEMNDGVISQNATSEGYREGLRYLNRLFDCRSVWRGELHAADGPDQAASRGRRRADDRRRHGRRAFQLRQYRRRPLDQIRRRARRWRVRPGCARSPFNPWGVGSGPVHHQQPDGTSGGGIQVVRWLVRPRDDACARSSASRSGKRPRAKKGNGVGRKTANRRLAATSSKRFGAVCRPSVRCKMSTGRSAVRATAPITCAWARCGVKMPGAWKLCCLRKPVSPTSLTRVISGI